MNLTQGQFREMVFSGLSLSLPLDYEQQEMRRKKLSDDYSEDNNNKVNNHNNDDRRENNKKIVRKGFRILFFLQMCQDIPHFSYF